MKPEENYTIIYTIAAHGILRDGKQTVLINEYDKKTGFYKVWNVEANIRLLASTFHNTYHIAFFACCREFYNSARHTGCFASKEEAEEYITRRKAEKEAANQEQESKEKLKRELEEMSKHLSQVKASDEAANVKGKFFITNLKFNYRR